MDATQHYTGVAEGLAPTSGLKQTREQGLARLKQRGFPASRDEEWKYTNTQLLLATPFAVAPPNPNAALTARALGGDGVRWVFVDGHFRGARSETELPEGVTVSRLAEAEPANDLDSVVGENARGFEALNSAVVSDGLRIEVASDTRVAPVLHIVHVQTGAGLAPLRVWIGLGKHAECTVVEHWVGEGEAALTSAVTEIRLEDGARLGHLRVQDEAGEAFHVGTVAARLARDSHLHQLCVAFGGRISRVDVRADLEGPGADVRCDGVYLGRHRQHMDHHTVVRHHAPHTTSNELYKGVLDDKARGVFTGRIYVHEGAQKTDAKQTNRNLLISPEAMCNSQPQLEIFADDVRCTHGSTVGQLDDLAVFYLRSRGIGEEASRRRIPSRRSTSSGIAPLVSRTTSVNMIIVPGTVCSKPRGMRFRLPADATSSPSNEPRGRP